MSTTARLHEYKADDLLTSWNKRDLLGHGGFAAVRKCQHKKLGSVAVKCFSTSGSTENIEESIEKQSHEAKILSKIKHKSIVQVHGLVKWSNCFGIIMDVIDGGNLNDLLQQTENLAEIPWPLRLRILCELADALCYLHYYDSSYVFVHGDLKPENVLLTLDLRVKLGDFGSANLVMATNASKMPTLNVETNTQHTWYYTAPEFLENPSIKRTAAMDVYSYGMLIYETVTRHQVFKGVIIHPLTLMNLIITRGQKPDVSVLQNVKEEMAQANQNVELEILELLEEKMKSCWSHKAVERPEMHEVRTSLRELLDTKNPWEIVSCAARIGAKLAATKRPHTVETLVPIGRFSNSFDSVDHPGAVTLTASPICVEEKEAQTFVILGGWDTPNDVLKFSTELKTFSNLPNLVIGRWLLSAVQVNGKILAFGGKVKGDIPTNEVECLDVVGNASQWQVRSPMNEKRYHASAAVIKGLAYVCGGWNDMKVCLSTIESYNIYEDSWKFVGNMKTPREGHSTIATQDKLFIAGGYDGTNRLSSFESFDPTTGQSTFLTNLPDVWSHHSAAYLDGNIYIMGGLDGDLTFLRKVSKYNIAEDKWSDVLGMIENRVSLGACSVAGKIYAVGGKSYTDSMVTTEFFDTDSNSWTIVAHMEKQWYRHAVVPI